MPVPVRLALGLLSLSSAAPPAAAADTWREAAAQRIERIRKADLKLTVRDASGRPVPNAAVSVRMKRHAFGFGAAVASAQLLAAGDDSDRYRAALTRLFNKAVLENDLKWPQWEARPQAALDALAWLRSNGIEVRGHNLVWPGWRWLPRDLPALKDDPAALRKRIADHIAQEAAAVRGQVSEWDVVNEPYTNRDLQAVLGDQVLADWFRAARAADPRAQLFLNDFNILAAGGSDTAHQNFYFETIRRLIDQHAPIEGIGIQGHFDRRLTPPERVLEILDRFATLGKPIEITEFDINIDDEQLQADYTRDFLTAVFSHPAVKGFLMWGFWEGRHWRPHAAMLRRDWSEKPNAKVWNDLLFRAWWTEVDGKTDAHGVFSVRAFQGDYDVTVNGKLTKVSLGPAAREVVVSLDPAR